MRTDLTGRQFGFLTVVKYSHTLKPKYIPCWECKCVCGKTTTVRGDKLKGRKTLSCGCFKGKRQKGVVKYWSPPKPPKPPRTKHPLYPIWNAMRRRILSPAKRKTYSNIDICDEWKNSFEKFLEWAEKDYKPGLSIDRIDNSKGYYPENCRWTDIYTQAANRSKRVDTKNKYKGIKRKRNRFIPIIRWMGIKYELPSRETEEEAARAYDAFIIAFNLPHIKNFE